MEGTTTTSRSPPPKDSKAAKVPTKKKPAVNRARRAIFAFITVGFSLGMMSLFALKGVVNPAAMSALDGFKDVAIWIGVGYIGGSAMDFGSNAFSQKFGGGGGGGNYEQNGDSDADGKVSD